MKQATFLKEYSGAAISETDVAELITDLLIDDNPTLSVAAQRFLHAKEDFIRELESTGFEWG